MVSGGTTRQTRSVIEFCRGAFRASGAQRHPSIQGTASKPELAGLQTLSPLPSHTHISPVPAFVLVLVLLPLHHLFLHLRLLVRHPIPPMAQVNYRLIDVDALDPENAFPAELITPQFPPVALADIQALATHCRQLLQRGDQEGALRSALENVPYGGDEQGKVRSCPRSSACLGS